ncbi:MAG: hypothetical protein MUD01_25305, partial [Chloroflexaceae bacterium]|nr:hypothetical protein [Chloroflexaceae bacterium]
RQCDLLIGNKPQIEHLLTELFRQRDPTAIGNTYLIFGTVEKSAWREGLTGYRSIDEMLARASDFATYYNELRITRSGYYPADVEPPILEPPPPQEWVKASS